MDWILNPEIWIALVSLTVLEVVLGIDNIVFISILAGKLPPERQAEARRVGLLGAMITRILLLLCISWITRLTNPLFTLLGTAFSGRDLVLVAGGLFLIAKATHEIHCKLEGEAEEMNIKVLPSFAAVIAQIMVLDIVFSLDSVITAVGMTQYVPVMIVAIVIAVGVMLIAVETISAFISRHPTVSLLALSFLLLIGVSLIASGFHHEIPRGYIYFAMGFSVSVEVLNLRMRQRDAMPVILHRQFLNDNP